MATIEETRVKLNEAIHQYANAAVLVDRDGGAWDADVEPFGKVKDAISAAMMAVLDTVDKECPYHSGDLHPGAEGNCIERVSARIAALGDKP